MQLVRSKLHIRALTFEYNGVARRELEAAKEISQAAGIGEHRFVRLPDVREAGDISTAAFNGMPPTYIPVRNAIFYSLAASYAEEVGGEIIVGGHNKDDIKMFADATPAFFDQLERVLRTGSTILSRKRMRILLPLSGMTKAQVIKRAASLNVPLGLTWSCHQEGKGHCWECEGCRARVIGFEKAGVSDPLRPQGRTGKIS